jgi:hypothetical protein
MHRTLHLSSRVRGFLTLSAEAAVALAAFLALMAVCCFVVWCFDRMTTCIGDARRRRRRRAGGVYRAGACEFEAHEVETIV